MRDYVRPETFGKQPGVTVSCNVAMLILSGVSGQHFLKDLFVQNNETVTTPRLPGAETYSMILGSSGSMENILEIEEMCESRWDFFLWPV